jgi:hypothetical protein
MKDTDILYGDSSLKNMVTAKSVLNFPPDSETNEP